MVRTFPESDYQRCRNTGCTRKAMQDGPYCSRSCMRDHQGRNECPQDTYTDQ